MFKSCFWNLVGRAMSACCHGCVSLGSSSCRPSATGSPRGGRGTLFSTQTASGSGASRAVGSLLVLALDSRTALGEGKATPLPLNFRVLAPSLPRAECGCDFLRGNTSFETGWGSEETHRNPAHQGLSRVFPGVSRSEWFCCHYCFSSLCPSRHRRGPQMKQRLPEAAIGPPGVERTLDSLLSRGHTLRLFPPRDTWALGV